MHNSYVTPLRPQNQLICIPGRPREGRSRMLYESGLRKAPTLTGPLLLVSYVHKTLRDSQLVFIVNLLPSAWNLMAEYAHLSVIDPEIKPLLRSLPSSSDVSSFSSINIPKLRTGYQQSGISAIQRAFEPSLPHSSEYTVTDHHIDVGDGVKVLARSITPAPRDGEDGTFPVLFWIHGGAFIVGDLHLDDYRLRIVSVKLRVSIVNCEYRLAPEHPFPAGLNDLTAALKYVASHPEKFSASLNKGFIVGGTSAGSNLAAVLSHLARDDVFFEKTPLTGQILHNALVIHYQAYPEKYKPQLLSLEQNKDTPILNKADIVEFMEHYKAPPADPRVSPLLLSSHKNLPPAFIQVYGSDPFRDEGLLYDKLLREAEVSTRLEVYPGVPHGFEGPLFPFFNTKQAVKFRDDFDRGLQWLLDLSGRSIR